MAVRLCLRVFRGDCLVGEHDFDRELIKIGRLASAHLPIDEPKASRIHAAIQAEAARISVVDMGSPEGTYLNGKRVNRATVQFGDEVRIGGTRIVIAAPRVCPEPPPPAPVGEAAPCVAAPPEIAAGAPPPAASEPSVVEEPPISASATVAEPPTTWRPAALERSVGPVGLQVRYYWGDALLQVSQHDRPESVFLGETGRSELRLSAERLGGREVELLSRSEEGGFQLNLSDGMRGGLARDGERLALDYGSWPLGRGDFAWVELAGIRAELQFAPQPRRVAGRGVESLDVRFLNLLLAVTLAAGLFAVSAETRAEADVVADDLSAARLEYVKTVFTQVSRPKPNPLLERIRKPVAQPREAEAGERHRGREGKAGREEVRNENGRGTVAAIALDSSSIVKRSNLLDAVRQATGGVATVFGRGGLGGELKGTIAGISGSRAADVHGFGGFGPRGDGPGGGGIGETVGIGGVSTPGRGGGVEDYGRDVGELAPKKNSGNPRVDDGGPPTIVGYDRDLIRKVIRDNLSQVRFCYEEALRAHPELSGRVVVRFVIDARGQVASAVIAEGSNLDDPGLERCLRNRVLAWQFAPPKGGGEAIVTYPFLFKPSGE